MSSQLKTVLIDLDFASRYKINLNLAAVYNALRYTPTYCDSSIIDNKTFYFVSRNMMCEKLGTITDKPDTMYRYYKKLEEAGLIETEKIGLQDWVHIVPGPSREWNSDERPGKLKTDPETRMNVRVCSDKRPSLLGQTSDIDREILNREILSSVRTATCAQDPIFDDAELLDLDSQSEALKKEKSSAKKEKEQDGPVTPETARRRAAVIASLSGQQAPTPDEPEQEAACTAEEATDRVMAELETDTGRRKLDIAYRRAGIRPGQVSNLYAAVYCCAENQLNRRGIIPKDLIGKLPGYLKTQLNIEARDAQNKKHNANPPHYKQRGPAPRPIVSREDSLAVAEELLQEHLQGTNEYGW
jgi:hypothetical protein